MERTLAKYLFDPDVNAGKMIFLSGPRQVGKTTFVQNKLKVLKCESLYFDWDDPFVRRAYTENPHFLKAPLAASGQRKPLVVFDEIHKHRNWKNILKGLYGIHSGDAQFVVTGSARLDFFRQSGDSLAGRYFSYRLLPLGLAEAAQNFDFVLDEDAPLGKPDAKHFLRLAQSVPEKVFKPAFERLMAYGGFPEPFLKANPRFSVKWRRDYQSLLTKEDLRDLTRIHDVKGIEQILLLLPERVASPLSINSLREDIGVNHQTVSNWLEALKKIYLVFSVPPWEKRIARAIRKEEKYYYYDWTVVPGEGAKFENAVAVSLLRLVNRWNEIGLGDFDLRYVRNQRGMEVDFLVVKNREPFVLIEAKKSDAALSKSGMYFSELLGVPYYHIVQDVKAVEARPGNRYVLPAWRFLALLG